MGRKGKSWEASPYPEADLVVAGAERVVNDDRGADPGRVGRRQGRPESARHTIVAGSPIVLDGEITSQP